MPQDRTPEPPNSPDFVSIEESALGPEELLALQLEAESMNFPDIASRGVLTRARVDLEGGQLHVYAPLTESYIVDDVYIRGLELVRLGTTIDLSGTQGIKRAPNQKVITHVSAEYLRRELNRRIDFRRPTKKGDWYSVDCPHALATNILGAGKWNHFNHLDAITTAPFMRRDLTVCTTPGYDSESRIYYEPNANFPPIPLEPTKEQAIAAAKAILKPFEQFPFADRPSEAAFLAHVLSSVARMAIDTVPISVYTAPLAGTGKSLLSEMAGRIASGTPPAVRPFPEEGDELRKVLMAALLAGDPSLLFDNLASGSRVRSINLCVFATAVEYSDRVLGASESPRLPNKCNLILTGNNITPSGDLARRCCIVRLDAETENARDRKEEFDIKDLRSHVNEHRPQLLVHALTVMLAHAQAPDEDKHTEIIALPSFEAWSRIVRNAILWLGYGDPVETQEAEADDEIGPLREAFKQIAAAGLENKEFKYQDLADKCNGNYNEDLRHAVQAAGCSDATNAGKITYWLRQNKDRVAGDFKLRKSKENRGAALWILSKKAKKSDDPSQM